MVIHQYFLTLKISKTLHATELSKFLQVIRKACLLLNGKQIMNDDT